MGCPHSSLRAFVNTHTDTHTYSGPCCVATASLDKAIRVWDSRSRQLIQHYPAHTKGVNSLQFHHSGDFLLSASDDGTVKVGGRGKRRYSYLTRTSPLPAARTNGSAPFIQVWDVREGRLLFAVHGHSGPVAHAAFSPDVEQTLFASAGKGDQLVNVWRANLGCYATKKQQHATTWQPPQQQTPFTSRPASAPPLANAPAPLQRVYRYDQELPGARGLRRPAYQRPTLQVRGDEQQPQQPQQPQTMEEGAWRSRSTLLGGQRQEGGLDLEHGDGYYGAHKKAAGGVFSALGVRLPQPSAPPAEAPEQTAEDFVPRRQPPPRPDSAGATAAAAVGVGSEATWTRTEQLQMTLQAMTQSMSLLAERLGLVEDRLAGLTINAPASVSVASASSGSATLQLPTPLRTAAAARVGFGAAASDTGRGQGLFSE
jgi:hypothetical protein